MAELSENRRGRISSGPRSCPRYRLGDSVVEVVSVLFDFFTLPCFCFVVVWLAEFSVVVPAGSLWLAVL